ncbi:MAG: hypothetical protein AAB584_00590 [Patescibacteria group bacterium]
MAKDNWFKKREQFRSNLPEDKDSYDFGGVSLGGNRLVITNAKSMNNKDPQDVPKISLAISNEVVR